MCQCHLPVLLWAKVISPPTPFSFLFKHFSDHRQDLWAALEYSSLILTSVKTESYQRFWMHFYFGRNLEQIVVLTSHFLSESGQWRYVVLNIEIKIVVNENVDFGIYDPKMVNIMHTKFFSLWKQRMHICSECRLQWTFLFKSYFY